MSDAKPLFDSERAKTTRAVILDAALRMASRDGIDGLTIGELAKAVGMSKSGLFAHFGGKDQLQLDVLRLATDRFIDVVMRPAFKAPRGVPRLEALLENWLKHLNDRTDRPGGSILIAASIELDDRPGPLRDHLQQVQRDLIANIERAARLAVEEKHFREDLIVEQFAWSMYSYVLGYHHFKRMLDDPKAELYLRRSFENLLEFATGKVASVRREPSKPKSVKLESLNPSMQKPSATKRGPMKQGTSKQGKMKKVSSKRE